MLSNLAVIYEGDFPCATSSGETRRFKKDMIRCGMYIHPLHGWKLNVTPDRMERWLTNFREMIKNGVDIEVPLDHSLSAEKNLGYVVDAMIEPDKNDVLTLFGIIEVEGDNAVDIVRRNRNVSVWVAKDFKDGKGNFYGEVIKHCSIVQQPVVPGQENFIPIAASGAGMEVPIYFQRSTKMTAEQLSKLRTLFGLGEDVTEENLLSTIETQEQEKADALKNLQDENLALKSAAGKKASSIDANTLELIGTTQEDKLKLLVKTGKITPAVSKKLSAILIGLQGARNEIALSLGENSSPSVASAVLEALEENDAVKLGEQTKHQMLGREIPSDDPDIKASKEGVEGMMSGAGIVKEEK